MCPLCSIVLTINNEIKSSYITDPSIDVHLVGLPKPTLRYNFTYTMSLNRALTIALNYYMFIKI